VRTDDTTKRLGAKRRSAGPERGHRWQLAGEQGEAGRCHIATVAGVIEVVGETKGGKSATLAQRHRRCLGSAQRQREPSRGRLTPGRGCHEAKAGHVSQPAAVVKALCLVLVITDNAQVLIMCLRLYVAKDD
jgi:hypothetical protein